jgi:predicted fused transcriptional regulator/phosphomethylpyrimidine kinase
LGVEVGKEAMTKIVATDREELTERVSALLEALVQ